MATCDGCGDSVAGFCMEECEDCDTVYCEDNGCDQDFQNCNGCGGNLCGGCGKYWRDEIYCDECYVFPHDE
ncbi:MAG: hypothetical protein HOL76_01920 [Euryarchaeota archaeon]|jgi:hypothetical protein|nr:hypothetical protein [Euryarchaeota archaeon]